MYLLECGCFPSVAHGTGKCPEPELGPGHRAMTSLSQSGASIQARGPITRGLERDIRRPVNSEHFQGN